MQESPPTYMQNTFLWDPEQCDAIDTDHRCIRTSLPAPETLPVLRESARLFPQVNCFQPPIVWHHADEYQVCDVVGNRWIDFSSGAVMANSGHGQREIREAVIEHADSKPLAQFCFASDVRVELAQELVKLVPPELDKVYFWTVGSETIECALRLARIWGIRKTPSKHHVLTHTGDFHGWTLGAHQLSGDSAGKPWLDSPDQNIHHLPFPRPPLGDESDHPDWEQFFDRSIEDLAARGVLPEHVAAVIVETMQGWAMTPFPISYMRRLRQWADEHEVLLVFDEMQTGFGRTGKWFGYEHYNVRPDMLCLGKGISSSLPIAALLGSSEVLDVLSPGEITTTHAAHPLSCAAALANLRLFHDKQLVQESARKGELARNALEQLRTRFPHHIAAVTGFGLILALHVSHPVTGEPDGGLARDWTWSAVKHGVMMFFTNRTTIKVCPPLAIPDDALIEGIEALGDALQAIQ